MVDKGLGRQKAYEMVQRSALRAWAGEGAFQALLESDPEVVSHLGIDGIRTCFDVGRALRHVDEIIDRALAEEVSP